MKKLFILLVMAFLLASCVSSSYTMNAKRKYHSKSGLYGKTHYRVSPSTVPSYCIKK